MEALQTKGKPLWTKVFVVTLGSAIFLTIEKIVDSIISNNYAIATNPITAASAYLFVGGWFGVIISLVLGKMQAKQMSVNSSVGISKMLPTILAILAGVTAALATLIFLWGNQLFDLSIAVAFSNVYVLFVVIYEWLKGKVSAKTFLMPGILVVFGTVLVAYTPEWKEIAILLDQALKLLVLLLGFNILKTIDELVTKPAVGNSSPIYVQNVRMAALALTGTVVSIGLSIANGQWQEFTSAIGNILASPVVYILLFVLFTTVYFGQILGLWAKSLNVDVSSIVIILGLSVGLGFMAALAFDAVIPGLVGRVPTDLSTRIVRLLGVACVFFATVLLQINKKAKETKR